MGRYPLPATPDGWYAVAESASLAPADVRPLRSFGRALVLFRGEDGGARLFDAHCPHLGAHLGVGGRVVGEGIRCPFHGWRFDGEGRCVEVPRLGRRPPAARVRRYPVVEREGVVFAWWHARAAAPGWEVPGLRDPESAWTEWTRHGYRVRTHVQDMAENILDQPHFWSVHDMDPGRAVVRFEGPCMLVEQTLKTEVEVVARTANWGPGISLTRVSFGPVETLTFITHTPIEEELVELELRFCMKRLPDEAAMESIARRNRDFVRRQFEQDIPIWESKVYREKPLLTAIDGPIPEYRRWYGQFYS